MNLASIAQDLAAAVPPAPSRPGMGRVPRASKRFALCLLLGLYFVACAAGVAVAQPPQPGAVAPSIEITATPPAGSGPESWGTIGGKTSGANPGEQRVVLYARTNKWYVQPWIADPFINLHKDGSFQSGTHLGQEYAALLVDHSFVPQPTLGDLPGVGQGIIAVTHVNADGR